MTNDSIPCPLATIINKTANIRNPAIALFFIKLKHLAGITLELFLDIYPKV